MTYHEIYEVSMPPKKRKEEHLNIWVTLAVRPLSIWFTKPLVNSHVRPTTITMWSIICLLVGFSCIVFFDNTVMNLIGWGFFFLWAILDGVDGNLARCTNQCSPLGDLWDTMGGYAAMVLIYMSAGIAAFNQPDFFKLEHKELILILGCSTSTISIFPRLILHKRKSSNFKDDIADRVSKKEGYNLTKVIGMNLVSPSGFMQVIFLIGLIFHLLNLFVVAYFVINTLIMLLSLRQLLRK